MVVLSTAQLLEESHARVSTRATASVRDTIVARRFDNGQYSSTNGGECRRTDVLSRHAAAHVPSAADRASPRMERSAG